MRSGPYRLSSKVSSPHNHSCAGLSLDPAKVGLERIEEFLREVETSYYHPFKTTDTCIRQSFWTSTHTDPD